MPKSVYRKRGGVVRYRTLKLGKDSYAHVAIVRRAGKRGGYTVIGKIRYSKHKKRRY